MNDSRRITKTCRECGAPLAQRVNRATQEPFLGCSRWPTCTYTEPIPIDVQLRLAGAQTLPGLE